jgi:hypothetical protein
MPMMTFQCGCCGAEVVGRTALVCIALGVRRFEERCPRCREWAEFRASVDCAAETAAAAGRAA